MNAAIFDLGGLPVAGILAYAKITVQAGVFDTFAAVISQIWHLPWLTSVLSALVGVGAIGGVFAWLRSPSRGLLATAHEGGLAASLRAKLVSQNSTKFDRIEPDLFQGVISMV